MSCEPGLVIYLTSVFVTQHPLMLSSFANRLHLTSAGSVWSRSLNEPDPGDQDARPSTPNRLRWRWISDHQRHVCLRSCSIHAVIGLSCLTSDHLT